MKDALFGGVPGAVMGLVAVATGGAAVLAPHASVPIAVHVLAAAIGFAIGAAVLVLIRARTGYGIDDFGRALRDLWDAVGRRR